jgi:hypothetical protein
MKKLWILALWVALNSGAVYAEAATNFAGEQVIEKPVPFLWNQVFGSISDELRSGRVYQYTVPLLPGQTMYVNVISPLKQAYLYVPGAEEFKDKTERPVAVRYWRGTATGKDEVILQVWTEWDTGFILEVTRK